MFCNNCVHRVTSFTLGLMAHSHPPHYPPHPNPRSFRLGIQSHTEAHADNLRGTTSLRLIPWWGGGARSGTTSLRLVPWWGGGRVLFEEKKLDCFLKHRWRMNRFCFLVFALRQPCNPLDSTWRGREGILGGGGGGGEEGPPNRKLFLR
jgi:hypothetical protein